MKKGARIFIYFKIKHVTISHEKLALKTDSPQQNWHYRLTHLDNNQIKRLLAEHTIGHEGLDFSKFTQCVLIILSLGTIFNKNAKKV